MKKNLLLSLSVLLAFAFNTNAQKRYLNSVFDSVSVTPVGNYNTNIWVPPFSGNPTAPGPRPLSAAFYAPIGDTITARPVVILMHTGSFLPAIINQQPTGNINDSTVVELATSLAKRGFAVMAINYRIGWNPATTDANIATGQLLNATYRAIQDAKNAVRYLRVNASTLGIDTSRIILGGQGTGGYASLAVATLNKYSEITLGKFIYNNANDPNDPKNGQPYIDTTMSGDWNGIGGSVLNISADPNESTKIHFEFNVGGAMGDSVWLEKGDVPMVAFHCSNDPFAPYGRGNVVVPTTGAVVISNASGSKVVIDKANRLGNNDTLNNKVYNDPYTARALVASEGTKNLFTFRFGTFPIQGSPWEWWDRPTVQAIPNGGRAADSISMLTNPDMSASKAKAYIDTIQGFLVPRIVIALNLPGAEDFMPVGVKEIANVSKHLSVYPNPATTTLNIDFNSAAGTVNAYNVMDITGRILLNGNATSNNFAFNVNTLNAGLYFVNITLKDGSVATKRVVIE